MKDLLRDAILNTNLTDQSVLFNNNIILLFHINSVFIINNSNITYIDLNDSNVYESPFYSYKLISLIPWNNVFECYASNNACITINNIVYKLYVKNKTSIFILNDNTEILLYSLTTDILSSSDHAIIGPQAFSNRPIYNITVLNTNLSFDIQSFSNISSLEMINLSNISLTSITQEMFEDDIQLSTVIFPSSLLNINDFAFSNCQSLCSITIPHGVTTIGNYCFNECNNLLDIIIPRTITDIGDKIFNNCSSLLSIITYSSSYLYYQTDIIDNTNINIYIPDFNIYQKYISSINDNIQHHNTIDNYKYLSNDLQL